MTTVVSIPTNVMTLSQSRFISITNHIIQPDLALSFSKFGIAVPILSTFLISQLMTYYIGFFHTPAIITYCSPFIVMIYFHTTFSSEVGSCQPDLIILKILRQYYKTTKLQQFLYDCPCCVYERIWKVKMMEESTHRKEKSSGREKAQSS